jgi:hypothetical protein
MYDLYPKLAKTPFLSFYVLCFFFYIIGEQEGGTSSAKGGLEPMAGKVARKRVGV